MRIIRSLVILLLPLIFTACGGDPAATMKYTGITTQAEITDSNAKTVVVDEMSNTSATSSATGASSSVSNKVKNKALKYAKALSISQGTRSAAVSYSDSEVGPCGGTVDYNTTVDEVTSEINSTATFSSYCEDDALMSGTMQMEMVLNSSQTDYAVNITFSNFAVSIDNTLVTMSGTMTSEGILSSSSLVLNMVMVDNTKSEQVKLENFVVTTGRYSVEYSGRIYHSTHGYVDVTTLEAMSFDSSGYMSSGSIKLAGASSYAILSAATNGGYLLEIDINADGTIDSTETGAWADLSDEALFGAF